MTGEEFWDLYINSTQSTLDIYDEAIEFFSKKLPEGFEDEYDVVEIILEVKGHHEEAKEFEKAFNFSILIKEKHPHLYDETAEYINRFLVSYYLLHNNIAGLEEILDYTSNKVPTEAYQQFLDVFNNLMFSRKIEMTEKYIPAFISKIEDTKYLDYIQYDFVLPNVMHLIGKEYATSLTTGVFDKEKIEKILKNYNVNTSLSQEMIDLFAKELFEDRNVNSIQEIVKKESSEYNKILQVQFVKSMQKKGFNFALSSRFWNLMESYWEEYNSDVEEIYNINLEGLKSYKHRFSGGFAGDASEMFALLWGSVYVYDFLLDLGLINKVSHQEIIDILRTLKADCIVDNPSNIWEFKFVHQWQKPNSVLENEFEAESKIFEKSLAFLGSQINDFKKEIADELLLSNELATYINIAEEKRYKRFEDNNGFLNNLFGNNEDSFIPPPKGELKPIVKQANEKIGRNDPCHCGSGKKYKKCCM